MNENKLKCPFCKNEDENSIIEFDIDFIKNEDDDCLCFKCTKTFINYLNKNINNDEEI